MHTARGVYKITDAQIAKAIKGTAGILSGIMKNLDRLTRVENVVSRQGLHQRINRSAALKQQLEAEREYVGDLTEATLAQNIAKGESWAVNLQLKYAPIMRARGYRLSKDITSNGETIRPMIVYAPLKDAQVTGEIQEMPKIEG